MELIFVEGYVVWCRRGLVIGQLGKVLGMCFFGSGEGSEIKFGAGGKFEFCWHEVSFSDNYC